MPFLAKMHIIWLSHFFSASFVVMIAGLSCPNGGYNNSQPQFGEGCMYRCHCLDDEQCNYNTGEYLRCAAGSMGPGCQYGDIAYNKATWQKTTRHGDCRPDNAVDGNPSTCSQTTWYNDPWWRVDLDVMYRISGRIIQSGETGALEGFEVRVGNVSSDSPSMYPRTCFKHNITDELGVVIHAVCAFEQVAQHLMILVSGKQTRINLCDVRVYGVLEAQRKHNDSEVKMASIGGAVGGAISAFVLILIVTGLLLWKKRRLSSAKQQQKHKAEMKKIKTDGISNTYENASILNQDMMIDVQKPFSNLTYQEPENSINIAFKTTEKAKENKTKLESAGISEQIHSSTDEKSPETFADISSKESVIETYDDHGVYYNLDKKRILTENLEDYVKKGVYLSTNIEQEYKGLVSGPQYDMNVALKPSNRPKNRYKEIYAYDKTRVVLDPLPEEPDSDYINACFINGYKRDKAYIAAQGPTTTIANDFWRMIWQYNIEKIVMLTELYEQGKQKCHKYCPFTGAMKFGTIQVEIIDEDVCTEYTVRFLKVSRMGYREQKMVTQFHFTAWPDRDVPDSPATLVQFWNKVRHTGAPSDSQTLVHCSAGIGRTGTYIALDYLYDEGLTAGSIHIFDCVNDLRRQRVGMVQNAEQYVYLHKALQEALVSSGKRIDVNDFPKYYQEMQGIDLKTRQRKLLVEFESFRKEELCSHDKEKPESTKVTDYGHGDEYACAKLPENKEKNRYDNIIPPRKYRPFLSSYVSGCNDCINVVCLPTRKNKNGLLLTQIPLPDTVVDFWRLVFEYDVQTLVMLNEENVPGEKIGVYWPKGDQVCQFGPFTVKSVSETKTSTHIERTLHIWKQGQEGTMKVTQFVCSVWKSKGTIPDSCSQFLSFMEEVYSWQRQSNNRPTIPHCLDGAECSGLFCVIWCVLDRVKADREVAIRSIVRQMQIRRQQIVPNFEQYQFCHDIVVEYLTNCVTYTNV